MHARSIILLILLNCGFLHYGLSQDSEIVKRRLRIDNLEFEFGGGLNLNSTRITSFPDDDPSIDISGRSSQGYQLMAMPLYRLSRTMAIRSGLLLRLRYHSYLQDEPWTAEYSEESVSIGIPALFQYSFGYSDLRFNVFSGFQFNYLIRNSLSYSTLIAPGNEQEGNIDIVFDRKRFFPEFQLGGGIRFQVAKMYFGLDVTYYIDLVNQSRYNPPRTVYLYEDLEPVIPFYSPRYWCHGIMINLTIQDKRN